MEYTPHPLHSTTDEVQDVIKIFRRIWRRRGFFIVVFAAIMLPLFAVIELWPSSFYASGTVIIGNLEPADSLLAAAIEKLGDPADLASQLLIAKSPRMIRLALERPGVFQAITEECNFGTSVKSILFSSDCSKLKPGSEQLLDYVTYHYSVQAEGRSRVISFGYSSLLPEVSFVLANALLVTYLEDQRGENARARESAVSWLLKEKKGNQGWQLKENFYHDLHKEMTDLETERRNVPNPARLVSLAEFPLRPSSPKRLRLLAAAFVITAFLAGLLTALNDLRGRGMNSLKASTSEPLFPAEATCEERDPPSEIPKSFGSSAPYDGRLRRMQPTGPAQPK